MSPGTAVVFGASGNVGRAAALGLLTAGYRVIAVSRRSPGLDKLRGLAPPEAVADDRLVGVTGDIATPDGRSSVLDAVDADGAPPLKAVISSFGPWLVTPAMSQVAADTYAGLWESNLHPHWHAWAALAPRMAKAGGDASYVIVSGAAGEAPGQAGLVGVAAAALFALAKWAMAEADSWGAAGATVTELRIALRVEDDAIVDKGDATEGDNVKRSSSFAALFPALIAKGRGGGTVRVNGEEFTKLVG